MAFRSAMMVAVLTLWGGVTTLHAQEGFQPHAGMMRSPDVSATHLVFSYANDLWIAQRQGGVALPLASPPGTEYSPKFSPDGQTVAFLASYDGEADIYTLPLAGGIPFRVTHHPSWEVLCDWTPDGQLLFSTSGTQGVTMGGQLLTVPPTGGMPRGLHTPERFLGTISTDGQWLVCTSESWYPRSCKRYQAGRAADIWLFHLAERTSQKITEWPGTDAYPMWHGRTVYYLSDAGPEHRLNIWAHDTETQERRQVTHLASYDLDQPSIGPGPDGQGEIVFVYGPELYLLDLGTEEAHPVRVTIRGDRPRLRPRTVDVSQYIMSWGISPTAKRAVVEARGDIWTAPAEKGSPRYLTRTSGVAERVPAWSPDGRWIAYIADTTGEYELYVTQSNGQGETRRLTQGLNAFCHPPVWSPDSRHLVLLDHAASIRLVSLDGGEMRLVDRDPWMRMPSVSWSPDSRWLAYSLTNASNRLKSSSIWLFDLGTGSRHHVTSGMFHDQSPTFDRKGDYLYFVSGRSFQPIFDDLVRRDPGAGIPFVYAGTEVLMAVPLREDLKAPWTPRSDEQTADREPQKGAPGAGEAKEGSSDSDEEPTKKVTIDLEEFERRARILSVPPGLFGRLAVNDKGQLIYVRLPGPGSKDDPTIRLFDIEDEGEEKAEQTVASNAGGFRISADGKKLLAIRGKSASIQDAAAEASGKDVITEGMITTIDVREEWQQIFTDTWRMFRDLFYAPNMHGVDWTAVYRQYAVMLDDCASREDLEYVLDEMIGELNASHASSGGGDTGTPGLPSNPAGLLGVDFEVHRGAYRIARIHEGAPWDTTARSPLRQPGVHVKEGDYLLAVNGVPIDVRQDPWAAFLGLAGKTVVLTVSEKPVRDGDADDIVVGLLDWAGDINLRYGCWLEQNRARVAQGTGGRAGYIYVNDTHDYGQSELVQRLYGQFDKEAFIIDERWNAGGRWPNRFVDVLGRPITHYVAERTGNDPHHPIDSHPGPKCLLINSDSGSGGDALAAVFREAGLGPLIGTRTAGWLLGTARNTPPRHLVDGGYVGVPVGGIYGPDGTWAIEGYGVQPDIEVAADPALMVDGGDPQLDAAIAYILEELERNPYVPPQRPRYPDRSGMGIAVDDR